MGDHGGLRENFTITEEARRYLAILDTWTGPTPTPTPDTPL
jgi:hypothetical protein